MCQKHLFLFDKHFWITTRERCCSTYICHASSQEYHDYQHLTLTPSARPRKPSLSTHYLHTHGGDSYIVTIRGLQLDVCWYTMAPLSAWGRYSYVPCLEQKICHPRCKGEWWQRCLFILESFSKGLSQWCVSQYCYSYQYGNQWSK